MELTKKNLEDIKKAIEALNKGGVIAFPTETVMGLGVLFDNKGAYDLLNKVKNRPEDKPYTLMVASIKDIFKFAYVDDKFQKLIKEYMPGPLTILLKVKDNVASWVTHNTGIIGIRIPNHPVALELLKELNHPILVPSANKSGKAPAKTSLEVKEIFKDELSYIIEGESLNGVASTIVDLSQDKIKIIREGPITLKMLEDMI